MRTEELLRKYEKSDDPCPNGGWEQLVWHAAKMIVWATQMRSTYKFGKTNKKSPFTQCELDLKGGE